MMCTAAVYPLVPASDTQQGKGSFISRLYNSPNHHHEHDEEHVTSYIKWRRPVDGFTPRLSPLNERFPYSSTGRFLTLETVASTNTTRQQFDIVLSLPIELSLAIFSLFSPQDLCNVCLVCREWFNLAQDRKLKEKRLSYVQAQRLTFQLCKENYNNGVFSTPQNLRHSHNNFRPILSPANNQIIHSDPQHLFHPSPPSRSSRQQQHIRTPSSSLSSMVERLSLNKTNSNDIRRCLFPEVPSQQITPTTNGGSSLPHGSPSSRKLNRRFSPDLVVGKRSNKGRLRRL